MPNTKRQIIRINNTQNLKINLSEIRSTARKVLDHLKLSKAELSISLVTSKKIKYLNKKYLSKDRMTDVMAFSQLEGVHPCRKIMLLGDVVLAPACIKKQAREYGNSFKDEFRLCLIHGILHLLGYDDENPRRRKIMEKEQSKIFGKLARF